MIHEFKKVWKPYVIGLLWLLGLLWPLLGIHPDGTLSFGQTLSIWLYIAAAATICLLLYLMNKSGSLVAVSRPLAGFRNTLGQASGKVPTWAGC
jgi:branched-chain amino acid transport system permease protein